MHDRRVWEIETAGISKGGQVTADNYQTKPIVVVPDDLHGPWHLAKMSMFALKQDGQHLAAAKLAHEMKRLEGYGQLDDESVIGIVEMFVSLETEQSAMAKTRTKSKMPKVDLVKAADLAIEYKTDAEKVVEVIEEMTVASPVQYETAASMCADVIGQAKEIDEVRRGFVDPLNDVVKNLNNFFRPALDHLDKCEALLKKKLVSFVNGEAEKRDQLLLQAGEADDTELSEELIEAAEIHVPPKVTGVSMRTLWSGEVIDVDKIPRAYMVPDVKMLKALTKAKAGDPDIPGWKATPTTSPAITVSKVKS